MKHVSTMSRRSRLTALGIAGAWPLLAAAHGLAPAREAARKELEPGATFEVIGELYALWVATNLNRREPSIIAIVPLNLRGPEILSARLVPRGAQIRILRKATPRWPAFLYPDRYLVASSSIDNPAGLPVVLDLAQGNEGQTTPLNPDIYRRLR